MKEILINTVYNENPSAYANEGKNIVHEIINLFKAENNKHYIYIVSDGTIGYEHNDKISNIFLTRSVGNKTAEIIALVRNPKQLAKKKRYLSKEENDKLIFEKQKEYIDEIVYDRKKIRVDKIFENNTYHNSIQDNVIYATFAADTVLKPKKPLFLTFNKKSIKNDNTFFLDRHFINQSQTYYIDDEKDVEEYNFLNTIIEDKKQWEDSFTRVDVDKYEKEKSETENHYNFLKLIHHEYYEPAFSNLFQHYFLKNKKVFEEFANKVLNVNINTKTYDFEVKREEHNIDILIRDSKNIIVIENKIKSGINGVKYDDYGEIVQDQLVKYHKYITEGVEHKNISKDDPRYNDKGKNTFFYIFAPNYKHLDNSKFKEAKEYKVIEYSKIYDFYKTYLANGEKMFDKYFSDFVNSLFKHTRSIDSELYDVMQERFIEAIKKADK